MATFVDAVIFDGIWATSAVIIAGMVLCIVDCYPMGVVGEPVAAACMSVAVALPAEHRTQNAHAAFECPIVPSDDLVDFDDLQSKLVSKVVVISTK